MEFRCAPTANKSWCSAACRVQHTAKPKATRLRWEPCKQCGRQFVARHGRRYCSDRCRVRRNIDKAMGAYRLATSSGDIGGGSGYFRRIVRYLAERDGDRCAICQARVDIDLPSGPRGDDHGPSIDHVVPRSHGGDDDLANVRLTHWACNRKRSNRGGGEQLRLVG